MSEVTAIEDSPLGVDISLFGAPQNESADSVGEATLTHRQASALQHFRAPRIGGKEDLERGSIPDLGIVLSRRAEDQGYLVAAGLFEAPGDRLGGGGEIRSNRDPDLVGGDELADQQ